MKISFLKFGFYAIILSMGILMTACESKEEEHQHQHQQHEHDGQHQHQHEHDGQHQHQQHEQEETSSVDKTGKEYTSAYICPMHCEGSGSDEPGNCPKCKMAYIENTEK